MFSVGASLMGTWNRSSGLSKLGKLCKNPITYEHEILKVLLVNKKNGFFYENLTPSVPSWVCCYWWLKWIFYPFVPSCIKRILHVPMWPLNQKMKKPQTFCTIHSSSIFCEENCKCWIWKRPTPMRYLYCFAGLCIRKDGVGNAQKPQKQSMALMMDTFQWALRYFLALSAFEYCDS